MELWVRSQDRTTLIRSYEIYIAEYGINSYVIRTKRTSHILGTYKTKERALEVLSEIHQRLLDLEVLQIAPDSYKVIKRNLDCVYEMPKE